MTPPTPKLSKALAADEQRIVKHEKALKEAQARFAARILDNAIPLTTVEELTGRYRTTVRRWVDRLRVDRAEGRATR